MAEENDDNDAEFDKSDTLPYQGASSKLGSHMGSDSKVDQWQLMMESDGQEMYGRHFDRLETPPPGPCRSALDHNLRDVLREHGDDNWATDDD